MRIIPFSSQIKLKFLYWLALARIAKFGLDVFAKTKAHKARRRTRSVTRKVKTAARKRVKATHRPARA